MGRKQTHTNTALCCAVQYNKLRSISIVIVQYNDRSLPDNLLLTQAPILVLWFDGPIILMFCYLGVATYILHTTLFLFLLFFWCPCMVINVISVQYNGGLLPDIILLTKCYYHTETRLNAMKSFCICSL